MHGYYFDIPILAQKLNTEFPPGSQFFMKTKVKEKDRKLLMAVEDGEQDRELLRQAEKADGESIVYWGEIGLLNIPDLSKKRITLSCNWLCAQHIVTVPDQFGDRKEVIKWRQIKQPAPCSIIFDVDWKVYYFPKKGTRVKMWTGIRDFCRFYKPDDPEILVWDKLEKEFVRSSEQRQPKLVLR